MILALRERLVSVILIALCVGLTGNAVRLGILNRANNNCKR